MKVQYKRVFWIVLDSFGIGYTKDANKYGDVGSNTFGALIKTNKLKISTLNKLGLSNIDGVEYKYNKNAKGSYLRLAEVSAGKDTAVGHFEMCGLITEKPYPTFPNGFPKECIKKLEKAFGHKVLCNKAYSGTEVIKDYGEQSIKEKKPIVYTSGDSVLQIACHESSFSVEELYKMCEKAREIMQGDWQVDRIIARPFVDSYPFVRSDRRKDYALPPKQETALDILKNNHFDVISVGKIYDIFSSQGITQALPAHNNKESGEQLLNTQKMDFNGLCFCNFNDFDSKYGHRNNALGYTKALNEFDKVLKKFISKMRKHDVVIITADHGNDPSTESTDHSREYVPCLIYGNNIKANVNLGTKKGLFNMSATILDMFNLKAKKGKSFLKEIEKTS